MDSLYDYVEYMEKDKLLKLLSNYIKEIYDKKVTVMEEHKAKGHYSVNLEIYYIDNENGKVIIDDNAIYEALMLYANNLGYNLERYTYLGGVRHIGFFTEDDSAYFSGVKLCMLKRGKTRTRK